MRIFMNLHNRIRRTSCMMAFFIIFVSILYTGCVESIHTGDAQSQLQIVTTIFAPYDFARSVTGEIANVQMLLKPGEDVHSYEPSPQDIIAIEKSDVFIFTGGENDTWVETILESIDSSKTHVIRMVDLVELYEEDEMDDEEVHHTNESDLLAEEEEAEWDEHVWTDPQNAILISQAIAKCCCDILNSRNLPELSKQVNAQCASYCDELLALDQAFEDVVATAKRDVVVFADRFPLRYFVEAYGLSYVAAFPGCSSEAEPSAGKVARMIDFIKEEEIPVVFKIELSNENMSRAIAEECGSTMKVFYSCHNISRSDYERGETYLSLMYRNLESLKEALN